MIFRILVCAALVLRVAVAQAVYSETTLVGSTVNGGDAFGEGLGSYGDTLVVGGPGGEAPQAAANANTGTAWVFKRVGSAWSEVDQIWASDGMTGDAFGFSIAISSDTIVVGAPGFDTSGVGRTGAAYVFAQVGGLWTETARLVPADAADGDAFGTSMAILGDRLVVGAAGADVAGMAAPGAVYVFERVDGGTWVEHAKLTAADPGVLDSLGTAVALGPDVVFGGALSDDNEAGVNAGAVYVFRKTDTWVQAQKLVASDAAAGDFFGRSLSASSSRLAVGAPDHDHAAAGAGAAYVFVEAGGSWVEEAELLPGGGGAGGSIALATGLVAVGAPNGGVGNQGGVDCYIRSAQGWVKCTSGGFVGAVGDRLGRAVTMPYEGVLAMGASSAGNTGTTIVALFDTMWLSLGLGIGGVAGVPRLEGEGALQPNSAGALTLTDAPPFALTILFVSLESMPVPFKGGTFGAFPIVLQLPVTTFFGGSWSLPWSAWPSGLPSGVALYFQAGVADPTAPKGVSLSELLKAVVP